MFHKIHDIPYISRSNAVTNFKQEDLQKQAPVAFLEQGAAKASNNNNNRVDNPPS
jgi:hypothetical protein